VIIEAMKREDNASRRASRIAVPLDPHFDRQVFAVSSMEDPIAEGRLVNRRSDVLYSRRAAGQGQEGEHKNSD
jgi:hypothetical protein